MNQADTAWMLMSTALVLLMTPALAFFYGGLVRSKNALNTMMMSFISLGFVGVLWAVVGYSLAFAPGNDWHRRHCPACSPAASASRPQGTIPHLLFMCYQGTFAIITAALISGAIVERMRFSAYVTFISLWALVVYSPVAHWVWGGGWLAKMGALDFAGGTVVHVNAGVAALVAARGRRPAARLSSRRRSCRTTCRSRCSAPGCCGSDGSGSTPAARWRPARSPALAFTTTMLAPAATLVVWTLLDIDPRSGKPTAVGAATGDRRRTGRDHAGRGLRRPDERDRARRHRGGSELLRPASGAPSTRLDDSLDVRRRARSSAARSARC